MTELTFENDKSEVLRYCGYRRGVELTELTDEMIRDGMETTNRLARIRSYWRLFDIEKCEEGVALKGTDVVFKGQGISRHLMWDKQVVLMCITIGPEFDREVKRVMLDDAARGMILNACGAALVEKATDELQKEIDRQLPSGHTGDRYSPGYGDFPIEQQTDFVKLLDMTRTAGIRLNSSYLMNPEKSVTAVAGIKD